MGRTDSKISEGLTQKHHKKRTESKIWKDWLKKKWKLENIWRTDLKNQKDNKKVWSIDFQNGKGWF